MKQGRISKLEYMMLKMIISIISIKIDGNEKALNGALEDITVYLQNKLKHDKMDSGDREDHNPHKCEACARFYDGSMCFACSGGVGSKASTIRSENTSTTQKQPLATGRITTPSATITEVFDELTGERLSVVQDEPITRNMNLAGTQNKHRVKAENRLIAQYGGKKGNWRKKTQDMALDNNGKVQRAEVHFFYEPSIGIVEQKKIRWRT